MATNTYVALDQVTLGSNGGPINFTNIPQTYKDLRIVIRGGFVDSGFMIGVRVGNTSVDTGQNYSYTTMRGSSSSATSTRKSNMVFGALCQQGGNNLNNFITVDFMNYSNTVTHKTWISRYGNAGEGTDAVVSLWRSTAAINTISIAECGDGGSGSFNYGNMLAGTTVSLYGIAAASTAQGTAKATGGTITYDQYGNVIHTFTSNGTFTPSEPLTDVQTLVIAGGGAGGVDYAGGGGAGGYVASINNFGANAYTVTIGAGGTGGTRGNGADGGNGTASTISGTGLTTISAAGGGGGGSGNGTVNGKAGGSGGGGTGGYGGLNNYGNYGAGNTPALVPSQGFEGGRGYSVPNYESNRYGGGGGGSASPGTTANPDLRGIGGSGTITTIGGTAVTYAAGGNGCNGQSATGSSAAANTGNGGEGSGENITGGAGGSGIVIIRYAG